MRLGEWLETKRKSGRELARILTIDASSVTRYVNGERVPHPRIMAKIIAATGGQVTANDFVGALAAEEDEPAHVDTHD